MGGASNDVAVMEKLYNAVNALQTETGEMRNQYFVKPVDRKVCCPFFNFLQNSATTDVLTIDLS